MIVEITERQFNAYCYIRNPTLLLISGEVAWYKAFDKLIATIIYDFSDQDFGFVILGRDKKKVFRCIEVLTCFKSKEEAITNLENALKKYQNDGQVEYEQFDEKSTPNEILISKVDDQKLHKYFKLLISGSHYEGARNLIKEIIYSYIDVDGNYIKDFQTTGFDSRLWELYLYMYFHSSGFNIDRSYYAPDYCLNYFGEEFIVEAVSVNASSTFDEVSPKSDSEISTLIKDYMPIKFGSSLTSKLQKKYWEMEHVKGKPLIIAIHDYHMPATEDFLGSMVWSRSALSDYLYGARPIINFENEKMVVELDDLGIPKIEIIKNHQWKNKIIPSNFFQLPESENISAVIFSNNATLTAFNRMGKLAGLGSEKMKMIRHGMKYNPDPMALNAIPFVIDIDDPSYEEGWADGMVMYHNPNALYPVDRACFDNISHIFYNPKENKFISYISHYDIISSFTMVFTTKKE